MKTKIIVAAFLFTLLANSVMAAESIQIMVKGMVCSFCAQGLTKKFKAVPSVETVKVTLKEKSIHLVLKDKQQLSDEEIKKIIEDAGYNTQSIERKQQ